MPPSNEMEHRPLTGQERCLVEQAQAKAVLDPIYVTLSANSFIAATTAAFVWNDSGDVAITVWLAIILLGNIARAASVPRLKRLNADLCNARRTLTILTGCALLSGTIWSAIAFLGNGVGTDGSHALVVFILGGLSAGAVIQSNACARPAIAMSVPALIAAITALSMTGTFEGFMIVLNASLLLFMLIRAARQNEASFIASEIEKIRTAELARSLGNANQEIVVANRKFERLANSDPMTGLGNRAAFDADLSEAVNDAVKGGEPVALMLFDIDRFKQINDTLGHTAGDTVLKTFANRLRLLTSSQDRVSRLGGDEFAVVVPGRDAAERSTSLAADMLEAARQPIDIDGRQVTIATSAGLAMAPSHARSPKSLYERADTALYAAKQQGRERIFMFEAAMSAQLERSRSVEFYLQRALEHNLIKVLFEPQCLLQDRRIVGFETMVSVNLPKIGPVGPAEIVAAAAALGLSMPLTRYVAQRAAAFAHSLERRGHDGVAVSINITMAELATYPVAAMLRDVTAAEGIAPDRIVVEVPEGALELANRVVPALTAIADAGFRLSIDHFGKASSTLSELAGLRVEQLKIDRDVFPDLSESADARAVLGAFVAMARALSVNLLVDGIETDAEAEILRLLGCRLGQGPLFGAPVAAENAAAEKNTATG